MFHFPTFPPTVLYIQTVVTSTQASQVTPFGNPRINTRSPTPQGISQAATSFISSRCQGIHHTPKKTNKTQKTKHKDARNHYTVNQQPNHTTPHHHNNSSSSRTRQALTTTPNHHKQQPEKGSLKRKPDSMPQPTNTHTRAAGRKVFASPTVTGRAGPAPIHSNHKQHNPTTTPKRARKKTREQAPKTKHHRDSCLLPKKQSLERR